MDRLIPLNLFAARIRRAGKTKITADHPRFAQARRDALAWFAEARDAAVRRHQAAERSLTVNKSGDTLLERNLAAIARASAEAEFNRIAKAFDAAPAIEANQAIDFLAETAPRDAAYAVLDGDLWTGRTRAAPEALRNAA